MRVSLLAIVFAVIMFGGILFFYYGKSPPNGGEPSPTGKTIPAQSKPSTATNYDECIAEGNKPLPDAPDKCLTTDGHVFIQGVVE